ncbi:MAG: penicillin-binding protein 2 [Gammaproteobacteria bacterium]|nr:MAG: penicillin-binding protein 2 [Gammaproteobacteria bacterium]
MKRNKSQPISAWRFYLVVGVLCSLLALLVGRVLSLQVLDMERGHEFLQDQGAMRSVRTAEIPAYRGVISDRRGEPLAVSTPVVSIWANPRILKGSERLDELAQALGMKLPQLQDKLARYEGKQFMYLQRHRVPVDARAVLEKRIRGVYGEREYRRFYPAGEVAAQLVGFTNVDDEGIAGLELAYNDWLQGVPGKKKYIKDLHGEVVRDIGVLEPARPGKDLTLSIDLRLQYMQHRELQRAVTALSAASGSIVTLDAHTGEILAMVNYPVYNPNSRKGVKAASMRNRAMTDVYEPGSTMKSLTLVAALESGRYTPQTMIDTTPGTIRVGRKVYRDPRNYGDISVTRVIQKSSQVGVTKIALELGHEPIWDVFNRFGIGQPAGTGFPGESAGRLPNRPRWHATEKISLAFGYGITTTPLQLARAYTVFANGGVQQPVSLLALEGEPPPGIQVVSPHIAAQVLEILHAVTGENGTARKARVPGYQVGGKTGTVRKVGPGGYSEDRHVALFAGIAPSNDPRLVTVVVINDPKGKLYGGGAVAAPVFSEVTKGALRILNVPPTELDAVAETTPAPRGGAA